MTDSFFFITVGYLISYGVGSFVLLYTFMIYFVNINNFEPLSGSSEKENIPHKRERRSTFQLISLFLILAVGLTLFGYLSYQNYAKQYRIQLQHQLASIAELKANELSAWRNERLGDAEAIKENPAMAELVENYMKNSSNEIIEERLAHTFDILRKAYNYDSIVLLNRQGEVMLASPSEGIDEPLETHIAEDVPAVINTGDVVFLDFHHHQSDDGQKVFLSLFVPIFSTEEGRDPLGVIVLRINPEKYLYPMISYWPVPSDTAETLLVRREGEEVVFLNPLRFNPDAALNLRVPLNEGTDLPAVKAVQGQTGLVEGSDYRGEQVLSMLRLIPNSPWYLVARMDLAEVYAPLTERIWQTVIFFGALFVASGAGLVLIWRQQLLRYFKNQAEAVEALRESEAFNRSVMDNMPIGVALNTVEPEVNFIYMNDNFARIYRTTKEALFKPDAFWETVYEDPQIRNKIKKRVVEDCVSGNPEKMQWHEIPITRAGRVVAYISAGNTPVPGKNIMISTVWDVTDRKLAEEALKENYALLKIAGKSARFGGWSANLAENTVTWSDEVAAIHELPAGYSPTVNEGIRFYPPEWRDKITKVFTDCVEKGISYDEEMQIVTAGGDRKWVRTIGKAIKNEQGLVEKVQGSFQDITEKKIAEEEIRRFNAELEQRVTDRTAQLEAANKELEAFAYSVSHDLRAPLRSMSGFSEALMTDYCDLLDNQGKHYLRRIQAAAERMGHLIDDLLNLASVTRSSLKYEKVDLTALANNIAADCKRQNPDRLVQWNIAEGLIVRGDQMLLRNVLVNLIGNAWKFTEKTEQPLIEIGAVEENKEKVFFVRDNGVGFNMAYVNKLFVPFQRLHSAKEYPGNGIGLATVQRIIARHGGRIWADSDMNRGAVFYFTLGGDDVDG